MIECAVIWNLKKLPIPILLHTKKPSSTYKNTSAHKKILLKIIKNLNYKLSNHNISWWNRYLNFGKINLGIINPDAKVWTNWTSTISVLVEYNVT